VNSIAPRTIAALSLRIKDEAQRLGFELVGISPAGPPAREDSFAEWLRQGFAGEMDYMERTAEQRLRPEKRMPWAVSVISVGMNYHTPHERPLQTNATKGWISRYAWGDDYHELMKRRLDSLYEKITKFHGEQVEGRAFVDSGPVLERDFAGVAGFGWIGKNTNLISPKRGSWFFLGELFLSIPLIYDKPIRDRCGQCDLCLKACPTQAFVGPYILDARRCISYLTIELKGWMPRHLRPLIGNHIFGCDICQEICPYNVKARPSAEPAFEPREGLHAPELVGLLALSEEEFRLRFRGSPIRRAKRRGFLRNVAVALGNSGSQEAVPALAAALGDGEPLVRGHAAWALGRIGGERAGRALRQRLEVEIDPEVRSEIEGALAQSCGEK
jgi:epoxyqueuosine reductase